MGSPGNDSSGWAQLPHQPHSPALPFSLDIPAKDVQELQTLLKLSKLAPKTYENLQTDDNFGVSYEWMTKAVEAWKTSYNWTDRQAKINRHPQFTIDIEDDDGTVYKTHFVALFSRKQDAFPIVLLHGWPGSFLEFLGLLDVVRSRYTPETCPYHLVVPSITGFTLSSGPRLTGDFTIRDASRVIDELMQTLGFESGYCVQGGDLGGIMAPVLAAHHSSVNSIHVNLILEPKPKEFPELKDDTELSELDRFKRDRQAYHAETGRSYAMAQRLRPATMGFTIGSSPISLLAWVGEKMLQWADPNHPLPLETVLDNISLYWFTDTIARNTWLYRDMNRPEASCLTGQQKPVAYSRFKYDIDRAPKKWVEKMCNLRFFRDHEHGGHFAAWERPKELWEDVEEFLRGTFPEKF